MTCQSVRTWAFCVLALCAASSVNSVEANELVSWDVDSVFGAASSCDCGSGGSVGCCCSTWRVAVEGLMMRRDQMDSMPLIIDPGSGNTLLNANDLDLDYSGGLRLTASRQLNRRNDIELGFFYVDQLGASATVTAPGAEVLVYGATFGSDPISLGYDTNLYNYEANWRHSWGSGCVKTLIGFRGMELGEHLTITDAVSPPQLFLGDVNNHLIGGQMGIEAVLLKNRHCEIGGGLKCGVYHNSADFDAAFPQAGPGATFHGAADHTAFSGELWLGMNCHLTDSLSLRLGYQAMWLEGVAILPEQLDDLAVPLLGDLDMSGSPLYHGATLGLQLDW
jgi:hypothetical protein